MRITAGPVKNMFKLKSNAYKSLIKPICQLSIAGEKNVVKRLLRTIVKSHSYTFARRLP